MRQIAKFKIEDVFIITGRGKVLAGNMLEGSVNAGNYLTLLINAEDVLYKIEGIEAISTVEKYNTGLLIKAENNPDLSLLDNLKGQTISILTINPAPSFP
ncbi:hypothetical protein FFF34_018935 [Inquilinus sp. KBS0705]|nr:hypothetical protein FFF34_018935 [Inquilinus sp. KBS0705]